MTPLKWGLFLSLLATAERSFADPVWDPTEIARLSQQGGQIATNLATTVETVRRFEQLATQIGAVGARSSFSSAAPAALASFISLPSTNMPAAAVAAALVTGSASSATQRQQNRQIWQTAYQRTAAEGLAVAQVASRDSGAAVARSKELGAGAGNTQDLRGDLQANSAVGLAVLSELAAVQAVLALLLEQQSLARLTIISSNGASS